MPPKRYDRDYFERWYRHPATRIHVTSMVERKVRLALAAAEYLIQRPVRTVFDVGCGEGPWQPILARLRPGVRYTGVDSSEYAVRRFGRRRNLRLGSFGGLGALGLEGPFDLIVCSDVLHYVPAGELRRGLRVLASLLEGMAWIEVFTRADPIAGDFHEMKRRSPAFYDRHFRAAGLVHCGLYGFVREDFAPGVTAFERGRGRITAQRRYRKSSLNPPHGPSGPR
jgi:SAM-dependent methyltransferase